MAAPATHQDAPLAAVPHQVIATWPIGTFIANLAVPGDGHFALSIHNQCKLLRVDRERHPVAWTDFPVSPAGPIAFGDGVRVVAGEAPHRVFQVHGSGAVEEKRAITGTLFLNGVTPAAKGRAFTGDSQNGQVIEVDVARWTARVVPSDERLAKISNEPMLPGANGIEAGDGCLFITSIDRVQELRADRSRDGEVTGLAVIADGLRGNDRALDQAGRLYVTNQVHDTRTRVEPESSNRVAKTGPAEGIPGSTAATFHPDDPGAPYVATTGARIMPFEGVPQTAKRARLQVGADGRPLPKVD